MSLADKIFIDNLADILSTGFSDTDLEVRPKWADGSSAHTIKKFCIVNRYDLSKEFPILTIRKINYRAAIDELFWIWQKKSNRRDDLNSKIWDQWFGEDDTIGKAYGYQMSVKHQYKEGLFDQTDRVLFDLKNNPQSRRILTNIYVHADLHAMNLYPCAYSVTFNVSGKTLNMILNQRSQDMVVANNWNVVQYAVLQHAIAQVSGLEVGELVHIIADAHIYDRHISTAEELIKRSGFSAPTFEINKSIDNFYNFTVDDFKFENYKAQPLGYKLEVAI
ncbi:MAG: thymidylate synthase [Christensenellaceae bacterium]|jgi:thymidylate synthase|nr:thymidylate synthase [Christensenellaceae bacterium]